MARLVAPVFYSNEVPVAVSLEEYIQFLTGVGSKPNGQDAWTKSVYTKSSVWAYERSADFHRWFRFRNCAFPQASGSEFGLATSQRSISCLANPVASCTTVRGFCMV